MRDALSRAGRSAGVLGGLLVLAGCASTAQPHSAVATPPTSTSGASAAVSDTTAASGSAPEAGSGSASATAGAPPSGTVQPPASAPSAPNKCLSGTLSVVYPASDNPLRSACVHLGTAVNVELMAIRGTTWSLPTASDPAVASVSDQVVDGGTRHDSVTLLKPGVVTLTSVSSYGPDPHGPASKMWTLTLTVVP